MSNNPEKISALKDNGLEIVERVPLHIKFHRNLACYLKTKREQIGHLINLPEEFRELPKNAATKPSEPESGEMKKHKFTSQPNSN